MFLRKFDCVINEKYKVVICRSLKCPQSHILTSRMFSEHIRKTNSSTTVRQADVTKVFKGLNNDIDVEQELASLGHDVFSEFTTLSNGDQIPKLPASFTIDIVDGLHVITNGFSNH